MHINGFGKMFKRKDEQLLSIPTPENFTQVVTTISTRYNMTCFEAIKEICDHYDREYESVKPLLTPPLKLALLEEMSKTRQLRDRSFLSHKLG